MLPAVPFLRGTRVSVLRGTRVSVLRGTRVSFIGRFNILDLVVTHIIAVHQEDHFFANIHRLIRDAF